MKNIFMLVLLILLTAHHAGAEQRHFHKSYRGVGVEFDYLWRDYEGSEHKAFFTLRMDDTQLGEREFKPYDNKKAERYVYERLKEKAKVISTPTTVVQVKQGFGGYRFEVKGRGVGQSTMQQAVNLLTAEQEKAMDDYLSETMYQRVPNEKNQIMPDYAKISKRYIRMMAPVARALMKDVYRMNEREVANKVLSFLQSIPYDTLRSRYTSNGAGFQTPSGLLSGNKGDCDTKSVTFAAIMRNIYPRSRILIVQVPGHAFVGFNFGEKRGDKVLRLRGVPFVLAEPVGPAVIPLGVVSDSALKYLQAGDYTYQEMPM